MCGIIGYTGARICKPFLIGGLERMEYRGYDSAGISLIEGDEVEVVRAVGNLSVLKQVAGLNGSPATTGIGHTRWATHGRPSEANAHPLRGCDDRFSVALNGIVENYVVLKQRLLADGHTFSSETDAEVVAHLLETHYDGDLVEAVRLTFLDLRRALRVLRRLAAAPADDRGRAPPVPDGRSAWARARRSSPPTSSRSSSTRARPSSSATASSS